MVNLKEIKWDAIKELCERVSDIPTMAEAIGLKYIFEVEVGIYECRVFSLLYKKGEGKDDVNLSKYHENYYFDKQKEFNAHIEEVNRIINEGWDENDAYNAELAELNKRYGK